MKGSAAIMIVLAAGLALGPAPFARAETAADAATTLFAKANAAYDRGEYQQALNLYLQIQQQNVTNGILDYNIGNAYFQLKQIGPAIVNYERAQRLLPRDQDIKANLELARVFTQDEIKLPEPGFFSRIISLLYLNFTSWELLLVTLGIYLVAALAFTLAILLNQPGARRKLAWCGAALLLPVALTGLSLLAQLYDTHYHPEAIVIVEEVQARSGPGTDFTTMFTIHEGTKVIVRGERTGWSQIILPNGLSGMVPESSLERIWPASR